MQEGEMEVDLHGPQGGTLQPPPDVLQRQVPPDPLHQGVGESAGQLLVRGVLGNKCAGQHNLKTVHFRETLAAGNFWHGHQQYVYFFAALYLP